MSNRNTATSRKRQFGIDAYNADRERTVDLLGKIARNDPNADGTLRLSALTVGYSDHSQRVVILANGSDGHPQDVSLQVAWALEWEHVTNHGGVRVSGSGVSAAAQIQRKLSDVLGVPVSVVSA